MLSKTSYKFINLLMGCNLTISNILVIEAIYIILGLTYFITYQECYLLRKEFLKLKNKIYICSATPGAIFTNKASDRDMRSFSIVSMIALIIKVVIFAGHTVIKWLYLFKKDLIIVSITID